VLSNDTCHGVHRPAHVVVVDDQHRRVGLGEFGQFRRGHGVQPSGAFALAGDDDLAHIPQVARNI
jgi:hypothetical protein